MSAHQHLRVQMALQVLVVAPRSLPPSRREQWQAVGVTDTVVCTGWKLFRTRTHQGGVEHMVDDRVGVR